MTDSGASSVPVYQCACGESISSQAFKRSGKCTRCRTRDNLREYRSEGKHVTPPREARPGGDPRKGKPQPGRSEECSYKAMHGRIKTVRGRAKDQECIVCHGPADEWAYMYCGGEYERWGERAPGLSGSYYSLREIDYEAMCAKHHRQHDHAMANTTEYRMKDLQRAASELGHSILALIPG